MTADSTTVRPGNKTLDVVLETDRLYGHDGLWLGPRGRDYGVMLPHPKPWQHANLYPDPNSTYWFAVLEMPPASVLTLRSRFPHCRYMQFALYRADADMGSYTATGEALVDHEITPDPGSENPFVPGADRRVENRDYTLRIVNSDIPTDPAARDPNTLYAGTGAQFQIVYRVYVPDRGHLGDAGAGLPVYTATLGDGTELSADEVGQRFSRPPLKGVASGMSVEQWRALCAAPDNDPELDPETTPARVPPLVERYFDNQWNLVAVFKTPEARAEIPSRVETGFGGDPRIVYLLSFVSRRFGPVLVVRGKMPRHPDTYVGEDGHGLDVMTGWESRYWSLIMTQAPPSGMGTDGISDFQVLLDADGSYTIVVCRPEDRPANATEDNGIAWLDWGTDGEGLDDEQNRTDFGMLCFRYLYNDPDWEHDPGRIVEHGTEAQVMGPYFPRLTYTDKAAFEATTHGPLVPDQRTAEHHQGVAESREAQSTLFAPARGLRYAEIFAVGPEQITVYNSMGLSEAPPALWDALDAEAAAQQMGVATVVKNGPHWWASDKATMRFGVDETTVQGIGFRFAARLPALVASSGTLEPPIYQVVETHKSGELVYSAGRPVYELLAPDGEAFVMQSANVEPRDLPTLGKRLSPVPGWRFRMRTLDKDLTVELDGKVRTVMDDLRNVYNHA